VTRGRAIVFAMALLPGLALGFLLRPANLQADFIRGAGGGAPPSGLASTPDFWWKLDETSGTAVANSGSYGTPSDYDGTVLQTGSGGTYSWSGSGESWGNGITGGIELTPVRVDTEFYCIDIDNSLPLYGEEKVTLAFWAERTGSLTLGDPRAFFQGYSFAEIGHTFMAGGHSGYDNFRTRINGATQAVSTGTQYALNTKTHFVISVDFSRSGDELHVYQDGGTTPDWTFALSGSAIRADSGFDIALIGCSADSSFFSRYNPWFGKLADVRIWLDAATGDDADAIYNNSL